MRRAGRITYALMSFAMLFATTAHPIQKRGVTDYQGLYFRNALASQPTVGNPLWRRRRCRLSGSPYCGA
jgi:hypothetical protein